MGREEKIKEVKRAGEKWKARERDNPHVGKKVEKRGRGRGDERRVGGVMDGVQGGGNRNGKQSFVPAG